MKAIINGRCIIPNVSGNFFTAENLAVTFNDKILSLVPNDSINAKNFDEVIDAENNFVSPGFINIHIHGCAGFDTMDDNEEALFKMRQFLPSTGVTNFLPTTMTMPLNDIYKALSRIRNAIKINSGAKIIGANVEGPYISSKFKGAQAEENIRRANFDEISEFVDVIKIITIAPEELDDFKFIDECHAANIIVSIGHSAANYDEAMNVIKSHNVKHITHLFNAQSGFHHRKVGIVNAALDSDVIVELIADNVHVHPAAQRLTYKVKNRNEIILITDSLRACGLGDGVYDLGGQSVNVKGELAILNDGTIAASVAAMNRVVKNFQVNAGLNIAEVVELVTKNPAVELNIYDKVGSIEIGKAADIIIFDDDLKIKNAIVDGNIISIN